MIEPLLIELSAEILPHKRIQTLPFPVITYADAWSSTASTAPICALACVLQPDRPGRGQRVRRLQERSHERRRDQGRRLPGGGNALSRREIDELTDFVKHYDAKGLVWIGVAGEPDAAGHYPAESLRSQVTKFLTPPRLDDRHAQRQPKPAT
jgi:aspartyl-tRNA synthetase